MKYILDDGSEVIFESAESDLVALHSGQPDVVNGGQLQTRLESVSVAAEQVAASLRSRLAPDEIELKFGLKVAGELNWWFFAKSQAEGTIEVNMRWASPSHAREPA
ncbi:CU044_2847 family protein [Streptomyces sp. NPDC001480]|uniref:CU044_2847 family protein n=1 Tax=Streptomyces sp. NPDC001480 TaxID=3364577 RepID=UPI00369874AC